MIRGVGRKSKNILATVSTKTKYQICFGLGRGLITKNQVFGLLDSDRSQIKGEFLLV